MNSQRIAASINYWLTALLALTALLVSGAHAQEWMNVTLTQQEYPPLIMRDAPYGGLLTQIVTESFRLSRVEVHYTAVPNNRAIAGPMLDLYEGSYGWAHSVERDTKLLYSSKPIYALRIVFFNRQSDDIPWKTLLDLRSSRIGVTQGNHYSDEFASLSAAGQLQTDSAPSDLSNFRKLLLGRIDLFPIDQDVGQFILKTNFSLQDQNKIAFQKKPISIVPVYVVIRRNLHQAKELLDRFDRGFQQLTETGQLENMIEAHRAMLSAPP